MKNFTILTHWASKCASICTINKNRYYLFIITMLFTLGVGSMWGATATYTLSTNNNGKSVTTGDVLWTIDANAIESSSSKCKLTGTITVSLPTGATLNSVTLVGNGNGWGNGATITFKTGTTTLNTFSSCSTFTLTKNKTDLTYSFVKSGTSSKNAWVKSITVDYIDAPSCDVKPTIGNALQSITVTENSIKATIPISAVGGCNITENGLVYSTTNSTPTVGGSGCVKVTTTACGSTAANKTVTITGLTCGQSYYIRGYATNEAGTSYTNVTIKSTSDCPKYTVTLKDDNSTLTQSSAGGSVTLPTREGCAGYTFAGWTSTWTSEQTTWTTIAPTIIPAGPYTPIKNVDLYPVYTKTAGGGTAYEKVTTLTEGVYVMVSEKTSGTYKYMPNTTSSGSNPTLGSGITMNNGKTSLTNDITEAMLWDLTATGTANQYYLRPHGSTTIGLGCTTSTGANIRISSSYKDVKWTITTSTDYGWQFKSNATNPMYLAVYTDDNWRNYTSSTTNQNGKFYLFKQTSSSTTSYISVPDCDPCNALQAPNVTATATANSITLSWEAVSGATSYNIYNFTTDTEDETTELTYTFTGLASETEYEWEVEAVSATCNGKGKEGTTTTLNACEQLGAATGLTVETDFVQDGQTYVKFSWTPANNTKNYAASQKLCFGKVGEAGTCVDDLEKNLTWTGDLKSKLEPGEYWWSIQALGDGTNYCDGDVVKGSNFTIYSITYNTNGGNTIPATSGTTLPAELPAPTKTGYTFAGWYTDSEFNTPATAGAAITQNTTLYAKWTINQYKVTLNPNYPNDKTGTFTYEAGELVDGNLVLTYDYNTASMTIEELYTSLTLDGYEFGGWYNAKGSNPGQVSGSKCTTTGDITGNKTYFAKWSKLYSITLSENGTTTTPTTQTSTTYKLPAELTAGSCLDDTKDLVGWSKVAIPTPGDKPTSDYYELGATAPLTTDQTTFYAVFATPGEGGDDIPLISFLGGVKSELLAIDGISGFGLGDDYAEGNAPYRVRLDDTGDYILYTNSSGSKITQLYIKVKMIGGGNTSKITVQTSDNNSDYADIDEWSIEGSQNNVKAVLLTVNSSSKYIRLYFDKGSNVGLGNLIFYTSSTSYSDYTTNCVKLPDPVLSFETEPANPVVFTDAVCGGNSSKQSVTVVGENLRDVVNVSVTGPYKIARTSSTALKDFTTSLTLDKTAAGAIHSNYQTVYIISTPPAQSTEATTGTLTFTTTKGNTLTVNLSTPTVTCTQYTLTLVDRGVSTEQPTKYYAGETINEAPADPEGVCTDPIHYVFDGWAAATVAEGSTTYTKVTFPYTVEGNTKFYAVYRYTGDGGEPSNDFVKVTSAKDDWTGDYVIVNEDAEKAIGNAYKENTSSNKTLAAVAVSITDNKVVSPSEDIIWQIRKNGENYTMYNAAAEQYAYVTDGEARKAGLSNSPQDMNISWGSDATKTRVYSPYYARCFSYYSTNSEWRTYATSTYSTGTLYCRSLETYLYTTSPICGPHLAVTEGKEIYVTGGNAQAARDLVMAQQKVSYKATRLNTKDGSAGGTAPDVVVADNGITKNGIVTSEVKVTFENTLKEQQADGTYTITGDIVVTYEAEANNLKEDIQVQLAADYNAEAKDNFTVHARSLPSEFVIVAKSGDKWYALNADMSSSKAQPANGQVILNDLNNPTEATFAPCNAIYTFEAMPQGAEDRISVRFIGQDNKYLWAASGTNTGIQNNSTNPAADALAYNWKLETDDNITYKFHNDNNSRLLGLSGEKFGMYASGVQDIRILPYEAKCLYNYAPSNLKVNVLKGSYVVLTWDAVAGATKYQYSTNGTTWTDAGTEPTVTINNLTDATEYTYYIRAYHEDAGVSQECIDYAEITFTTANCDDVPTDISFAAGIYSITLYWQCAAETSTVILYSDEAGTQAIKTITDAKSPLTIDDLDKVTTYYAKILAGGTCASPLTTVSTAPPAVDVVEWKTDGMDVYVNTDDEIIVSLEGEVYEGSGSGNVATELFFSKYFEATGNVKLLALFNGTGQDINLSTYSIKFSAKGADYTGATTTEEVKYDNTIELSEDIPYDRLILPAGKELIMISYPTSGADGAVSITNPDGTTIKIDSKDAAILECAANNSQESGWDDYVRVTSPLLNFSGNDAVALFKGDQLVDIIGAGNTTNVNMSKVVAASTNPSFMDAAGWYNANGYQIQPDGTIGTTNNYPLSTNRCLLIRRNTVINGDNAVEKNTTDFVTLGGQESEWMGYQIPDGNGACEGFEYVGKYDYANYYTTYDKVGEDQTFESGSRNSDGTVPVSIPEIGKYSCKNLKITVKDEEQVLVVQEFKVPIIVAKDQDTNGEVFTALKTTLGTVVVDKDGNPTGEIESLTEEEWIEECKECDIVVRDNATLTHVTTGLDQFRDLTIYPTGKLSNIESNLAVNRLMIQAENDQVGYAIIEKGGGSITANAIAHTKRIDAQYWYAFSLPYDCNINEITQANGESMGEYGVHWGIQYYDGKRRQQEGTSANLGQSSKFWLPMGPNDKLNAYQGYLIALFDASVQKPTDMRTIYFPPAEENTYTELGSDSKQTNVYSWNVNLTCEKRHHGWNFTGTPYISMFNPVAAGITDADLSNVLMTGTWDPVENEYEENEHVYVSIPTPNGGKYYNQHLASTKELLPFMAYFVQTSDPTTGDETKQLTYAKGGRELPAAAPARAAATAQRILVELLVTAPDGQTDNTGVWVDENYVPEYELAADLTKMYVAGEKPQLYTLAANNEKMAYNALPDGAATNIPLGLYAPITGDYNLSLNERMSRIAGAESVELIYNNAVVANLLFQDYTITANKGNVNGYSLCIRRRANVTTAVDNFTGSVITMIVNDGYISVLGVPTDATVYVYDMVGHLMEMQSANGNTVVNMPSVPQGVYNIVITNDKGSTTIKSFVK